MNIKPFAFQDAPLEAYRSHHLLKEALRAERMPDMPPLLLEESIAKLKNLPGYLDLRIWGAWEMQETRMIAVAEGILLRTDENQHMLPFTVGVHPDYRQQGLGKKLLTKIANLAQEEDRHLLITTTYGSVPGGEICMNRLGATPGLRTHLHKLDLTQVDRALLQQWQKRGQASSPNVELGLWKGPFPEQELPCVARLMAAFNDQPKDDLQIEDLQYTPERVQEMDNQELVGGIERWVLHARDRITKRLVGYTAVYFQPDQPHQVGQGDTGVFPQYRRQGIGRWLKAAMLEKILSERPEARFITTSNADSNESMLKINQTLGYKPYLSQCLWQVELDTVLAYL